MEGGFIRTNTLASSAQIRRTSLFHSLSSFLDYAQVESFIHVTKTGTRKSKTFLVVLLVIKNKDVLNCALYQVKQMDHGKTPFQIKTKYDVAKLRLVNGVSEEEEETELELVFEKGNNLMSPLTVKWTAESGRAKRNFLISLWKLVNEHMTNTPQFLNINYNMLQDSLSLSKTLKQVSLLGSPSTPETKEYKYLTGEEERDLGLVTEGIDWAVENAEDFMEKLMNELSGLTKANIHSIMAVETDVIRLFNIMDHALHELCRLEDIMVRYEDELNEDRLRVEETLQSYKKQQIRNDNTRKLHDVITDLLEQISYGEVVQDILLNLPLKTASQMSRLTEAVHLVQEKREQCNNSPLIEMSCIADERDKMDNLLQAFSLRVIEAVSAVTTPTWNAAQSIRHSKLIPLLPVVNWLATYNKEKFEDLAAEYQVATQTTYQKVLREFFEDKRSSVTRKSTEKLLSKFSSRKSELALSQKLKGSSSNLQSQSSLMSQSNTSLDSVQSSKSESEFMVMHGHQFESSFRDALDFIEITMSKEEGFINKFFADTRSAKERHHMEEVVLCRFTAEIESFINASCKFDLYYALPVHLSVLDRLDDAPENSFLYRLLRQCLETSTVYFNKMCKFQKERILESNKKSRRGTASSVLQFTQFLLYSESLQKNTKRTSLETCYAQLAEAVCESIGVFATNHSKLPADVATIENYYFIYHFLFRNKIDGLDKFRSHCHKKHKDSLEKYVKSYLGTPLDKINVFFDGVQLKLNSGVPHQEIGFYSEFSKQKLKALIADYSVKEVKKGLESVMKKIEKHFTKEQNLFTVACLTMQAEFIKQVEGYENLMKLCYPDAGLKFLFSIAQIHAIFDGKSPKH